MAWMNPLYLKTSTWSFKSDSRFILAWSACSGLGMPRVLHPGKILQPLPRLISGNEDTSPTRCQEFMSFGCLEKLIFCRRSCVQTWSKIWWVGKCFYSRADERRNSNSRILVRSPHRWVESAAGEKNICTQKCASRILKIEPASSRVESIFMILVWSD
jgi:hypothetical protein